MTNFTVSSNMTIQNGISKSQNVLMCYVGDDEELNYYLVFENECLNN